MDIKNEYIEIINLSVIFGVHEALKDITLSIPQGSFLSIVGPNGGGKSTLLKVIIGLIKPEFGEVKIFGYKPGKFPTSKIGYVPQIKNLDRTFPALSVELVTTGITSSWPTIITKNDKFKALESLEFVGAKHLAEKQLKNLSGGELQRIYLARSLVRKPKLLLLDEPVTGIDFTSEIDFIKTLDNYHRESNATILMVTHDWEVAYHHSDYALLLNRINISFDKPQKTFNEANLRKAYGHIGHAHEMIFGGKNHD